MMYATSAGNTLASNIYSQLRSSSPGTNDKIGTDTALSGGTLYELRATNMTSAYVEAAFHTYGPDVTWLQQASLVGKKIADGIDTYFGRPRCPSPGQICPEGNPGLPIELPTPPISSSLTIDLGSAFRLEDLESALDKGLKRAEIQQSVNGVFLTGNTVIVDVSRDFIEAYGMSTSAANAHLFGVIHRILFEDNNIKAVVYSLDGDPIEFARLTGLGFEPFTREMWAGALEQ